MGLDWNDSMSPAYSLPNGGTAPSLTAIFTNISGLAYGVNDLGHFAIQMPHTIQPLSDLRLHCHFVFPSQPTAGRTVRWECYYSVAAINGEFSAESAAQYGEYTIQESDNKVHRVQSIFSATAPAIPQSCILIGRIRRVASTGTESNVNPILLAVDAHFQQGPMGTQSEFA
jgi:hypothetical protein